jgi:hypothetical protein
MKMTTIKCAASLRPADFVLMAQNRATYECIGLTGDAQAITDAGGEYTGPVDGFEQRYLPGHRAIDSLAVLKSGFVQSQIAKRKSAYDTETFGDYMDFAADGSQASRTRWLQGREQIKRRYPVPC